MPAAAKGKDDARRVAVNRKARHDYTVLETLEAGIELRGTEVKSVREAQVALTGAFVRIEGGDAILREVRIAPYEFGNQFNHDPQRPRRLLLHRKEIDRLAGVMAQQGCAIVPLSIYFKKGRAKVELGVCKGKQNPDKRETIRRRTADREAQREIAGRR